MSDIWSHDMSVPGKVIGWDVSEEESFTCYMEGEVSEDRTLTITKTLYGREAETAIREHLMNLPSNT